uniref:Uncharacterized protein n=1 Tax=Oryza glumipatula TaxID=40148 RepID=A0A0E0BH67_9ORYZ
MVDGGGPRRARLSGAIEDSGRFFMISGGAFIARRRPRSRAFAVVGAVGSFARLCFIVYCLLFSFCSYKVPNIASNNGVSTGTFFCVTSEGEHSNDQSHESLIH